MPQTPEQVAGGSIRATIAGGLNQGVIASENVAIGNQNFGIQNFYFKGAIIRNDLGRQLLQEAIGGIAANASLLKIAKTRYVGREEAFGSIVYDREYNDYILFDGDATKIFRLAETKPTTRIYDEFRGVLDQQTFDKFVELCQAVELIDADWNRFAGVFINRVPSKPGVLSAPTRVHLACTRACNFRCRHCFSSSGHPYADELTTTEITHLIDQLADLGCFQLSLGGGEPLVRRDLPTIIAHANARGVAVEISTNASAATRQVVETLKGLGIARFKVSMDAASERLYDSLRGEPGAFQAARQGIENLKTLEVPISLRCLLMKPNAAELPALMRLAEELQAVQITFNTILPVGRAVENPDLLLDWQETNRLWEQVVATEYVDKLKVVIPQQVPPDSNRRSKAPVCVCGQFLCHVDARGEVSPTGFLKDSMSAGNLRRSSFKDIWDLGVGFEQMRKRPGNNQCTTCTHYPRCGGGCRASAALVDHDINLPDANCALAHIP
jgi:radical SAM protein with 4Fe4S-binding SPASM domain